MSYVEVGYALNNFICHKLGVVFSSEKLLSTAFWIMWEKGFFFFFLLGALVESISVPLRTQATIMFYLLKLTYNHAIENFIQGHLVIFSSYNGEYNTIVIIK